ncbi:MAG: hypothetical protein KJ578_03150 [Bacteroidetes bacterium]|nr:hypothetical protein [Bacteroidota bacterium]MBU2465993.1 hypothetical protein [Bacteroidota bacterium]MBU2556760.1 hypothetical protein [Bacteroidota bacterium]
MKPLKLCLLILTLSSLSAIKLFAQETNLEVQFESRLETVLILNIDPESNIEFRIEEVNEHLYQITEQPDDIYFSVESTGNWNLSIASENPYFVGISDSSQKIPVDFLGFSVESLGTNWDNGLFSNIANYSRDTTLSLSNDKITVLTNGRRGNIGGAEKNNFVLRWKFVFEDEQAKIKRFDKMAVKADNYRGNFYIILSETQSPSQ